MFANSNDGWKEWNYLTGDIHHGRSISAERYQHLQELSNLHDGFQIAFKDPDTGAWTTWRPWTTSAAGRAFSQQEIMMAYDIHRSVIENEIVIESDQLCSGCQAIKENNKLRKQNGLDELSFPKGCNECYVANYEATRVLGAIIEDKGFVPSYYYSGSKSIHVHVYIDLKCLLELDKFLQQKLLDMFKTRGAFMRPFMEYLRRLMIECWGVKIREFDIQLVKATHLIRAELSKNKRGYKTFIGYTYKDLSFVPPICNETTKILPELGTMVLSRPHSPQELIEEFLSSRDKYAIKMRLDRKQRNLAAWLDPAAVNELRPCVKFMLSDQFKTAGDGYQRAMFILANELKQKVGEADALAQLHTWNEMCGSPIRTQELEYRVLRGKEYTMTCSTIHAFLDSIGFKEVH